MDLLLDISIDISISLMTLSYWYVNLIRDIIKSSITFVLICLLNSFNNIGHFFKRNIFTLPFGTIYFTWEKTLSDPIFNLNEWMNRCLKAHPHTKAIKRHKMCKIMVLCHCRKTTTRLWINEHTQMNEQFHSISCANMDVSKETKCLKCFTNGETDQSHVNRINCPPKTTTDMSHL